LESQAHLPKKIGKFLFSFFKVFPNRCIFAGNFGNGIDLIVGAEGLFSIKM